jgi:CRISPR-associated exonuclease Cas4
MFQESDYTMISALQHYLFCKRQCALIHVEQLWQENYLTMSGQFMHEKAHEAGNETRKNIRISRGLRLASAKYGLAGITDIVEFRRIEKKTEFSAILPDRDGFWTVFPVEYKRGKAKEEPWDEVQLCAQALCLEEMLNVKIERGALFYGEEHRRRAVEFDEDLRKLTENIIEKAHELINSGKTPPPILEKKCKACSLNEFCIPKKMGKSAKNYESTIFEVDS